MKQRQFKCEICKDPAVIILSVKNYKNKKKKITMRRCLECTMHVAPMAYTNFDFSKVGLKYEL